MATPDRTYTCPPGHNAGRSRRKMTRTTEETPPLAGWRLSLVAATGLAWRAAFVLNGGASPKGWRAAGCGGAASRPLLNLRPGSFMEDVSDDGRIPPSYLTRPLETKSDVVPGIDLETSCRPRAEFSSPIADRAETLFRHSSWRHRRQMIWDAMHRTSASVAKLDRFENCGSCLWLRAVLETGELGLVSNTCHDRWCEVCGRERAAVIAENAFHAVKGEVVRFVTLTLKHSPTSLSDQLDRINASFNRLRERRWWKDRVRGGAAFLEVKLSEKSGLWHPHLHLIIDSDFLDQRELSQEWLGVTGDSSIVDVRLIRDFGGVAAYVTKYVTKPASAEVYAVPERLDEMILAMRGRRLCATFGSWRGLKLSEVPPSDCEWKSLGSVTSLWSQARSGDERAIALVTLIVERWPQLSILGPLPPPGAAPPSVCPF